MADARFLNRSRLERLAQIPAWAVEVANAPLEAAVEKLVQAEKRACPVEEIATRERAPGELRDSIHKYETGKGLSWRIIADARDLKGVMFGVWVEFGHGEAGPHPFWYPTYRAWKKPVKAELNKTVKTGIVLRWDGSR